MGSDGIAIDDICKNESDCNNDEPPDEKLPCVPCQPSQAEPQSPAKQIWGECSCVSWAFLKGMKRESILKPPGRAKAR